MLCMVEDMIWRTIQQNKAVRQSKKEAGTMTVTEITSLESRVILILHRSSTHIDVPHLILSASLKRKHNDLGHRRHIRRRCNVCTL